MKFFIVASIFAAVSAVPSLVNTGSSAVSRSDDGYGNYAFGYNEDHATGGTFRKEQGGPGYMSGSYGLRDADGRMRVVNYIADALGYRASVSTNEPGTDVKQDPAAVDINYGHGYAAPAVIAAPLVNHGYAAQSYGHGYAAQSYGHGYVAPIVQQAYAAPVIQQTYAAPVLAQAYAAPVVSVPAYSHSYSATPLMTAQYASPKEYTVITQRRSYAPTLITSAVAGRGKAYNSFNNKRY